MANKKYKQASFDDIIESERQILIDAKNSNDSFFNNALEFSNLLHNFIKHYNDPWNFISFAFLSQVKKHHILALLSATRLHHVQCGMNLRQVLEAWAWVAYAMSTKEQDRFYIIDENDVLQVPDRLKKAKNTWLNDKFNEKSTWIKKQKELINESVAHSNIFNTLQNFKVDYKNGIFENQYFDYDDEYKLRMNYWYISNIAMGLLDLFYGINNIYNVFQFADNFLLTYKALEKQSMDLRQQIMKDPRYKKYNNIQQKDIL